MTVILKLNMLIGLNNIKCLPEHMNRVLKHWFWTLNSLPYVLVKGPIILLSEHFFYQNTALIIITQLLAKRIGCVTIIQELLILFLELHNVFNLCLQNHRNQNYGKPFTVLLLYVAYFVGNYSLNDCYLFVRIHNDVWFKK
mgnify:CR=1 FL=1